MIILDGKRMLVKDGNLTLFQPGGGGGGGGGESTPLKVFPLPSPQKSTDRLQTF